MGPESWFGKGIDTSDIFFDEITVLKKLSFLELGLLGLGVIFDDFVVLVFCLSFDVRTLGSNRISENLNKKLQGLSDSGIL